MSQCCLFAQWKSMGSNQCCFGSHWLSLYGQKTVEIFYKISYVIWVWVFFGWTTPINNTCFMMQRLPFAQKYVCLEVKNNHQNQQPNDFIFLRELCSYGVYWAKGLMSKGVWNLSSCQVSCFLRQQWFHFSVANDWIVCRHTDFV